MARRRRHRGSSRCPRAHATTGGPARARGQRRPAGRALADARRSRRRRATPCPRPRPRAAPRPRRARTMGTAEQVGEGLEVAGGLGARWRRESTRERPMLERSRPRPSSTRSADRVHGQGEIAQADARLRHGRRRPRVVVAILGDAAAHDLVSRWHLDACGDGAGGEVADVAEAGEPGIGVGAGREPEREPVAEQGDVARWRA